MFQTIVDIFLAGTDSTATHLTWALLYMAKYKDVQNKCRKEIVQVHHLLCMSCFNSLLGVRTKVICVIFIFSFPSNIS